MAVHHYLLKTPAARLAGLACAALLLGLLTQLNANSATTGEAAQSGPPAGQGVAVYTARAAQAATAYVLTGVVEPVNQAVLAAQVGGRIVRLSTTVGATVKAGQLLATIDARTTQAGVAQASAQQEQARANYKRVQALRDQGFLSAAAVDAAKAQLTVAQAAQAQATTANSFTRITAPFDGVVQTTHQSAGDVAMPGMPVITMYAPSPLRIAVQLPLSGHSKRQPAEVPTATDSLGHQLSIASVSHASGADPSSQTVLWRLNLSPAKTAVLVGQTVNVSFAGEAQQALRIPAKAVVQRGEMTAVYVATPGADSSFVLRAVRTASVTTTATTEMVSVLAGLRAGEQVAMQPLRAAQGAPVGEDIGQSAAQ